MRSLLLVSTGALLATVVQAQMVPGPDPYARPDSATITYSSLAVDLPVHPDDAMVRIVGLIAIEGLKVRGHSDYLVEVDPSDPNLFDPGFIRIQVVPVAEGRSRVIFTGYTLPHDEIRIGSTPIHHESEQIRLHAATSTFLRGVNRKTWAGMARLAALLATVELQWEFLSDGV